MCFIDRGCAPVTQGDRHAVAHIILSDNNVWLPYPHRAEFLHQNLTYNQMVRNARIKTCILLEKAQR